MNEFMNRNSGEVLTVLVCILLAFTILTAIGLNLSHTENMAKLGYVEKQLIGTSKTIWVKSNEQD